MAEKNKYCDGLGADCLLVEGVLGYVFARPNTANQIRSVSKPQKIPEPGNYGVSL